MEALTALATNKIFIGCAMLVVNLGSRHIAADLSPQVEAFMKHKLFRKVILFCIIFVATRDIMTAIILMFAFTVVIDGLLNPKSRFNLFWRNRPQVALPTKEESL